MNRRYLTLLILCLFMGMQTGYTQILPPPPPATPVPVDGGILLILSACAAYGAVRSNRKN